MKNQQYSPSHPPFEDAINQIDMEIDEDLLPISNNIKEIPLENSNIRKNSKDLKKYSSSNSLDEDEKRLCIEEDESEEEKDDNSKIRDKVQSPASPSPPREVGKRMFFEPEVRFLFSGCKILCFCIMNED